MSKAVLATAILAIFTTQLVADQPAKKVTKRPQVEVVFCLDTTGSMGGLINAAKQKIWSISNQIAVGNPTPELKVGLVAYRDRGDAYVTKIFDLTADLDSVNKNLMGFQAGGGGDFPESVNQALHESVTKVNWTKGNKALKIIFLVGDAPPKMNYQNDVKFQDTCQLAAKSNIIINTIQCGNRSQTQKYWKEICRLAEGSYVQIDAKGGPVVVMKTPFDKKLSKINRELAQTTIVFGSVNEQKKGKALAKAAEDLSEEKAADRAAFYSNARRGASYDLLENIRRGNVKLEDLKKEQLPPGLRKMDLKEQKAYLKKLETRRAKLAKEARQLDQQRKEFIAKKQKEDLKNQARDSFDNQVLTILQRQATRINVRYKGIGSKNANSKKE